MTRKYVVRQDDSPSVRTLKEEREKRIHKTRIVYDDAIKSRRADISRAERGLREAERKRELHLEAIAEIEAAIDRIEEASTVTIDLGEVKDTL